MKRTLICFTITFIALSCAPNEEETATKGHLRILVAESVAPVLEQEIAKFMNLYQTHGADVTYAVMQSEEADARFVNDTARIIVTTVPLTDPEKAKVKKTTDNLAEIVLAYDGVVAVVQNRNHRNELSVKQLRDLLSGTISRWEQLSPPESQHGRIRLVFEDSSDVSGYFARRLLGGAQIKVDFSKTTSSEQTLQEVSNNPNALGFVGLNWANSALDRVKILSIAADSSVADTLFKPPPESFGNAYSPHPAYLYLNYYPMKRAIYVYARTTTGDFATGVASFFASPAGQKIFLEAGLVPGTQKIVLKRPD